MKRIGLWMLGALALTNGAAAAPPGDRTASAPCVDLKVVARGADLLAAREMMVDVVSDDGAERLRQVMASKAWHARERRYALLWGHSPFSVADDLLVAPDFCFNRSECNAVPSRGPAMLIGCQPHNCSARAALLEEQGAPITLVTTFFKSQSNIQKGGQDVALFVENSTYPRDRMRRLAASWYVLHQRFVPLVGFNRQSDIAAVDRISPDSTFDVRVLECVVK